MKLNKKIIFPKSLGCFTSTIGEIPTSYLKSLSYEEQLMWFCNYFKNVVVPTLESTKDEMKILKEKVEIIENELTKYYTKEEIDTIVNNINSQLENIYTKTEIDNIINGINTQLENIYTKEEIDNIIDDLNEIINDKIDETNAEVERAMMVYNALPKVEGTGTSLTLNNTANAPMKMIPMASELEQETTSISGGDEYDSPSPDYPQTIHTISGDNEIKVENKNLLYLPFDSYNNNGITTIINNSGISINGTATKTYGTGSADVVENLPADTYTLSINKTLPFNIFLQVFYEDGTNENKIISRDQTSITFTTTQKVNSVRLNYSGFTINTTYNEKVYMQIEKGSTATQYTPHEEQKYELNLPEGMEVCKIGDYEDEFVIPSNNLFDKDNVNILNCYMTSTGTIGNSTNDKLFYINCNPSTSYTIQKILGTSGRLRVGSFSSIPVDGSTPNVFVNRDNNTNATITTGANDKYIAVQYFASDTNEQAILNSIMVNIGTTALPYEPFNDGKWYLKKNIKKAIPKPTTASLEESGVRFTDYSIGIPLQTYPTLYCSHFKRASNYAEATGGLVNSLGVNASGIILCNVSGYTMGSEYVNLFTNNDISVYFPLATSEYILLNDTLQTQLNNIRDKVLAYQDQTNISQVNNDLPFTIKASAIYDLNKLVARVAILETE